MEVAIVLVHMNALTERHRKLKQSMHIWGWGGDETCYINSSLFYSLAQVQDSANVINEKEKFPFLNYTLNQ